MDLKNKICCECKSPVPYSADMIGGMCLQCVEERFLERGKKIAALESQLQQAQESYKTDTEIIKNCTAKIKKKLQTENEALRLDRERYKLWINDLQSGMYVNCVYCGHRYGPEDEVPSTMADVLKEHIEHCPEHPMSKLKAELEALRAVQGAAEKLIEQVNYDDTVCYLNLYNKLRKALDAAKGADSDGN